MKRVKILILGLLTLFVGQNVFGQTVQTIESQGEKDARARRHESENQDARNRLNGHDNNGANGHEYYRSPLSSSLYKGKKEEDENLKKAFERTKNLLVVPETYYQKYNFLLKDKKVKLARLQPDRKCYGKYLVSLEEIERCTDVVPVSGGGSLYSFKLKLNYPLYPIVTYIENNIYFVATQPALGFGKEVNWWDINFIDDKFVVQNSSTRGIIADIGDVDLKDINLKSKELEFLNNFKQKDSLAEVKEQNETLKRGISFNNFNYFSSVLVKLNSTYVLRSIDYSSIKQTPLRRNRKQKDKRADLLIVFKVLGREDDGSAIILWKELKAGLLPN